MFFRLRHRFDQKKAKKLLRNIDSKKITFDEAKEKGLIPPLITSYWVLKKFAIEGRFL